MLQPKSHRWLNTRRRPFPLTSSSCPPSFSSLSSCKSMLTSKMVLSTTERASNTPKQHDDQSAPRGTSCSSWKSASSRSDLPANGVVKAIFGARVGLSWSVARLVFRTHSAAPWSGEKLSCERAMRRSRIWEVEYNQCPSAG